MSTSTDVAWFQRTADDHESAKICENALKASYLVALRIAKCKKPHQIAEQLILPAAVDMCRAMINEECANKLKTIPLSNNTMGR